MRTHPQLLKKLFATVIISLTTLSLLAAAVDSHQGNALRSGVIASTSESLFSPVVIYDSGGASPLSIAVGDVNGDGRPDIVVANTNSNTVGVLLGNGNGTFQAAATYGSGGLYVLSVAVADVNGDGKPDVVVGNACASNNCIGATVGVLLGNGDGTFQRVVTYDSGGGYAESIAVADVNGDGKPDLLVANYSSQLGVLLGNGDGTFQSPATYSSGGHAQSVVVADVNGDGKPDVVVANGVDSRQVGVLLGNGDGTFQPVVLYDSGGANPSSAAVADVNGDGKPDLLVVNRYSFNIGVLVGNGDGTFRRAVTYNSGGDYPASVAVADVNGDGKPDMVVANNSFTVGILLGNGNGSFKPVVVYASGGYSAESVAIADVNGDGKPDVLVANACSGGVCEGDGVVGVLLNKPTTNTALTSSLNPSIYGQKVTWTATVTSSGSITPTGKVQFTWSGYTIGSATLNSSGVATLTKSNLNADSYPLTAVYSGDVNNLRSTSAIVNQVVTETTSAAKITSTPNPSTLGRAVTFAATITSPTVTPTGPVTFMVGTKILGTAQLSGGKAKFTISTLAVGSTKVTATYYGDSNIAKSSASVTQTVHQ